MAPRRGHLTAVAIERSLQLQEQDSTFHSSLIVWLAPAICPLGSNRRNTTYRWRPPSGSCFRGYGLHQRTRLCLRMDLVAGNRSSKRRGAALLVSPSSSAKLR